MTDLVDRLKSAGRIAVASAAMMAGAAAIGGCGGRSIVGDKQDVLANCNDDGAYSREILDWYELGEIGDNYLMCPIACPPEYRDGDDPITEFINIRKQERWDYERSYYQFCIEEVRKGRPIPQRETLAAVSVDFINQLMGYQLEWIRERAKISAAEAEKAIQATEKAQKELEKLALLKGAWEHDMIQNTVVSPGNVNQNVNLPYYHEGGVVRSLEGEIGVINGVKIKPAGLTIDDQKRICNGDYSSVDKVIAMPKLQYQDCKHRPKDALNEGDKAYYSELEKNLGLLQSGEFVMLSCGNASKTSGNKCENPPKDYGNADISWKRAVYALAGAIYHFKDKLSDVAMAAFMNRTELDRRTAEVYLVRKNAPEQQKQ